MAKAEQITGLDCAADAVLWASEVLRVRFVEVTDLREAALNFLDVEGVHAMRVATRRLRSAMQDFAPLMKKRLPKKLKKDLKRIADALGAVRDQDVAIAYLEKLQGKAKTDLIKDGIGKFIKERGDLRAAACLNLIKIIAAREISDLQAQFAAAIDEMASRKQSKRMISFSEAGLGAVASGLQNLFDLSANIYHPFNAAELHETRIAAKRLRYAIELFIACWGEAVAPFAAEIAEMQSFLGEVHDCDVWIESLGKRLKRKNGAADETDFQTAVWLLSRFVKKRNKEYRSALKLWCDWETNHFAERLRGTLRAA